MRERMRKSFFFVVVVEDLQPHFKHSRAPFRSASECVAATDIDENERQLCNQFDYGGI